MNKICPRGTSINHRLCVLVGGLLYSEWNSLSIVPFRFEIRLLPLWFPRLELI